MFDYNLIFEENKGTLDNELVSNRFIFVNDLLREGDSILDIGCANGNLMSHITKDISYVGLDISKKAIENNHYHSIVGNAEKFKLNTKFDKIVCLETLEHLERPDKAIACMFKHLKDDGLVLITVPMGENHKDKTHIHFFYKDNLVCLLRQFTNNFIIKTIKKYELDEKETMFSIILAK